jgi:iron complex transport system substrate-binding protein
MGFRRAPISLGRWIALAIPGAFAAGSVAAWDGLADHATPRRIIAIAPNSAEVVCALGACDAIIGVSKFCVFPAELKERPLIGGLYDPDLEKIIALRPDLLITRGRNESLERVCEQMKVPIYHDETDTLAGIEKCVRELGQKLGRSEAAEKLVGDFRLRLDAVRSRTRGKAKPRVMLTVSRQPDRLANILTTGRGTFLDELIEFAGGVNVFGAIDMIYPEVSAEAIIAKQPQVIIELMPEVKLTDELEKQVREQWRKLGAIPAVTDNRVYLLTDDNSLIPSPRYVEFVEKVSRILHSEGDR